MKKLTKPHTKNIRLDAPLGLLGVPPDAPRKRARIIDNCTVIIMEPECGRKGKRDLPQ